MPRGRPAESGIEGILGVGRAPLVLEHSVRRPSGYLIITEPESPPQEGETLSCVHCQYTWKVQPGSGRKRGFCFRCNGVTCHKKGCNARCIPLEQAIERMEARDRLLRKVTG